MVIFVFLKKCGIIGCLVDFFWNYIVSLEVSVCLKLKKGKVMCVTSNYEQLSVCYDQFVNIIGPSCFKLSLSLVILHRTHLKTY